MEAQLKSRSRAVPKTVGRTIGVLPIDTRRKPIPRRLPPSTHTTASGGTSRKVVPPSERAPSNKSYRTLANSQSVLSEASIRKANGTDPADLITDNQVANSPPAPERASASARHPRSAGSARGKKAARPSSSGAAPKRAAADCREKKTFSPSVLLEMCHEEDYSKVYEIDLHGTEITHIPDFEKFRKLRVADISGNFIHKIENLELAQDLRDLKLYDNRISTIEGLNSLKELVNLQLQHNNIETICKGFIGQKKLKCLRLDSNCLTRLETSELVSCVCLTTLDLSNNRLSNLSALSYLPNLEELFLSGNSLDKVTDLQRCRKLQELDLSKNRLSDLAGLEGLQSLQILDVSENQLKSVTSAGKLRSLEDLNVSSNQLSVLAHFPSSFPKLQILNVCDNLVQAWAEVCALKGLAELVEICLAGNPLTLENGECPAYHTEIQGALPTVEIVDGAHVRRPGGKGTHAVTLPLMRPMSAASVISVRQIDAQLRATLLEQQALQQSIVDRFASLKSVFETLPAHLPPPMLTSAKLPAEDSISGSSSVSPPPSSRCSRRSRIREAQAFASSVIGDTTKR